MINREDKKDVDRWFGAKMAKVIARTTDDSKTKALANKKTHKDEQYDQEEKTLMAEHRAKKQMSIPRNMRKKDNYMDTR